MLLCWAPSRHASAAAIALDAVGRAVATHARPVQIAAIRTARVPTLLVLYTAVAADQTVISVVAAVGQLLTGVLVRVQSTVRTVLRIWVIGAIGTIVRVFARLVVAIGVKGAVVAIPCTIL